MINDCPPYFSVLQSTLGQLEPIPFNIGLSFINFIIVISLYRSQFLSVFAIMLMLGRTVYRKSRKVLGKCFYDTFRTTSDAAIAPYLGLASLY